MRLLRPDQALVEFRHALHAVQRLLTAVESTRLKAPDRLRRIHVPAKCLRVHDVPADRMDHPQRRAGRSLLDAYHERGADVVAGQQAGEVLDRRPRHELAERDGPLETVFDLAQHRDAYQRIAAEREELVLDADFRSRNVLLPYIEQLLLERRPRLFVSLRGTRCSWRSGECPTIDLLIRSLREARKRDHRAWHHVLREPLPCELKQIVHTHVGAVGDDVADQLGRSVVGTQEHDRLVDFGVEAQRLFDLAELHAKATDLHLEVAPTEEYEVAFGFEPTHVARPVQPLVGFERTGNEPRCGQLGIVAVAPGQADAADEHFAGGTERDRPQLGVQHVDLGVGQRPPDRQRALRVDVAAVVFEHRAGDRRLGRSVSLEEPHLAFAEPLPCRQRLT